ncbi:MAG TPA: hypothetical protein VJ756_12780 [Terriglobales bacterium]|jgi:hypothetical protein|nr:hypothetical protein [Terriglobales bacterium]
MAKEVILYFEDPNDALRFTLAAGSVMAGDRLADGMTREMRRATRITLGNPEGEIVAQSNPELVS